MAEQGVRTFSKNQIIFKEGQVNPVAYMVKKGAVILYRVVNNRRVILNKVKPGGFFGEISLVSGEPYNATAEATEYTELIPFDDKLLKSLLLKSPGPIQRIVKHLMARLRVLETTVFEQPTNNMFMSVCQILDLQHKAAGEKGKTPQVSYNDLSKIIKNTLLVSQKEINDILAKLQKLGGLSMEGVKESKYKKNIFGELKKQGVVVHDWLITLSDPDNFLSWARTLSKEMEGGEGPYTKEIEYIDINTFAERMGVNPQIIYRKIGARDFPEDLLYISNEASKTLAAKMGRDFFTRVKRRRVKVEEMETVDDLAMVDNATLQEALPELGFHKVSMLYSAAGEETREKIVANLSRKMAAVVADEAASLTVDETDLAAVEDEIIARIKKLKGK